MLSTLRLLIAVSLTLGVALAQQASPTPGAAASQVPTPPPAPAMDASQVPTPPPAPATEGSQVPTPPPAPDAASELSPAPEPPPPAGNADVIPMEGGAPLETKEIGPAHPEEAMPEEPLAQPNAIIPDERPGGPPIVPPSFESAQEKARQVSIRYREVRVQAEKDPKVVSLLEQAERAKTFEDQRAALREYYRLLFKKIASIDKSLTEKCKVMEVAYIRRLAQERLEPTIPMNPPPTPEPLH